MTNSKSRLAYGTINPCRFVQDAPGIMLGALQCSGPGVPIIGIAPEWTDNMMGTPWQTNFVPQGYPAAASGEGIRLYEDGEDAMVYVGSGQNVLPGSLLYSDASGNAVPLIYSAASAGIYWIGARAIEGGTAGTLIRVSCYLDAVTKP